MTAWKSIYPYPAAGDDNQAHATMNRMFFSCLTNEHWSITLSALHIMMCDWTGRLKGQWQELDNDHGGDNL